MKRFAATASLYFSMGLMACQPDSSNSRPEAKPSPTPPPAAAAIDPNKVPGATPPGVVVPKLATAPVVCTDPSKESPVPTGEKEASFRACCSFLKHGKACLDKTKVCILTDLFPSIENAMAAGKCGAPVGGTGSG